MRESLSPRKLLQSSQLAFREIREWLDFLYRFFGKKAGKVAFHFEISKDFLVDLLISKRGRYTRPFLNLSLFVLVAAGIVGAPIIADSYPLKDRNAGTFASATLPSTLARAELSTATQPSDKGRFEIFDYTVEKGDTLSTIGDKFDVSVDSIKWGNNLKTENLQVGQTLRIPPVTGIIHRVKPGETIYSIAKKYKSDPQKVVNFPGNDFADLDTFALNIGQSLVVPDGVMPEAPAITYIAQMPSVSGGGSGIFIWPAGGLITQYPVSYHMALDIANPAGPGVAAAGDGIASIPAFMRYGYGNYIILDNGGGMSTLYAHLAEVYVNPGQRVTRGQIIGKMGSTGRSTGIHLHFEVRKNGVIMNPMNYLK
ncbi:MAG: Peptidase M23 family protein [Candidatus Gottesmanbacteria bacterium GW2011_GWC2_39_8]|uniref:Peptidase M23 family protein n=1 Tax=Candidatus Gottesmanbacteria bacterium GW2011_GWC2_39_8 TaxID=1618450 RepID=A0A0G0PPP9_9BACT|nr:MAG: Peptidase M23 family protein [Candidatus Gottesmanbacteria bacterium GW2011_GWC2_39_8]